MQSLCLLSLFLCAIAGMVLGDKLPFQCPYKVPDDSPQPRTSLDQALQNQPAEEGGGLSPDLFQNGGLDDATRDEYGQYRAALASVPCDGQAISVFLERDIGKNYTVSVIFVYKKPVDDLKIWLE